MSGSLAAAASLMPMSSCGTSVDFAFKRLLSFLFPQFFSAGMFRRRLYHFYTVRFGLFRLFAPP